MSDLIDRQQALDCFHDWIDRYGNEHTSYEDVTYQRIAELPAVQPDHTADIGKKVSISCGREDDLISRQVTINVVGDWIYNPGDLRYHKDVINSIPAVQPEIVRCKDCKHWDTEWSVSESGAHYCPMVDGNRNSDFYCADAERRTDG